MKPRRVGIVFVLVFLLAGGMFALAVFAPLGQILGVLASVWHIGRIEAKLQSPGTYRPFAETLARYCQSDPAFFPEMLDYAWFPPEFAGTGQWHGRGRVTPDGAHVEFGGGFR